MVRRADWQRLDGFEQRYFMYGEDLDLGLRLWLTDPPVGVAPAALVEHDYEFAKGGRKWFLLRAKPMVDGGSTFPGPLLALVLVPLLASELALMALALRDGWLREKIRAQAAVLMDLRAILRRRRQVQATRQVPPGNSRSV